MKYGLIIVISLVIYSVLMTFVASTYLPFAGEFLRVENVPVQQFLSIISVVGPFAVVVIITNWVVRS